MRRTEPLRRVSGALLADPDGLHWGYDLLKSADVRSGVLYPILSRMLAAGWLHDGWEEHTGARPPRRYYTVTAEGLQEMRKVLDR